MKTTQDPTDSKAAQVRQMFNRIAPTYDLLNDCISFGMHRQWKLNACRELKLKPGHRVLDVCTGTGDLVSILSKEVTAHGEVVGLDFSEEMLAVARTRFAHLNNVRFQQGDALALPFEDNSFEGAIVSFGLRNVADIQQAVREMARVVRPGGWVVNLDTCPDPKLPGYWFYFSTVMPLIGRMLSMDPTAYKYLSTSTKDFMTPQELESVFRTAGLKEVKASSLAFGSVSRQSGQKPLA